MLDNVFLLFIGPLNAAGIRYAVTGSVAGTAYGEPRLTNDVDIVVDVAKADVERLLAAFSPDDFYVPPVEIVELEVARPQRGHFNVIHHDTGFKADFYPKGGDPFQEWALAHTRRVDVDGTPMALAPPEYVIVKKLEFYREGGSQKHVDDIGAIVRNLGDDLDRTLLEQHVTRLGLGALWAALGAPGASS